MKNYIFEIENIRREYVSVFAYNEEQARDLLLDGLIDEYDCIEDNYQYDEAFLVEVEEDV